MIAELDLGDGNTVETRIAAHWTKDEVAVVWADDNIHLPRRAQPIGVVR